MRAQKETLLKLLNENGPGLHALLTRLTLNEHTAEDLMQELFLKLCNSDHIEKIKDLSAYAHRTAINLAFDWRRKQARNIRLIDRTPEPTSLNNTPAQQAMLNEQSEQVLHSIGRLEGATREVIVMRYIEQQEYEQIASSLEKTEHQVRALCQKGLLRLRELLNES